MKKRAFAAACAAMSLALTLTACGTEAPEPSAATTPKETTAAATPEETTTTTPPEETTTTTTEAPEPVNEIKPEDFEYYEVDGGISVYGYKGDLEEVVIPAEIDGKPVVRIGEEDGGRSGWGPMKSVVIPEGVTTLGDAAFYGWRSLENVTIPSTLVNFEAYSKGSIEFNISTNTPFEDTAWLTKKREEDPLVIVNNVVVDGRTCTRSVEIPEGVTHIAPGAFAGCSIVTSFTLPESLESIGACAFRGCSRLEKIVVPESVTAIGEFAFYNCNALADITLPEHAMDIGYRVFWHYAFVSSSEQSIPWLKNKIEENPLVIVGSNLIDARLCTGDVVVPDSVQSIAGGAFSLSGVTSVKLPEGLKKSRIIFFIYAAFKT